MVARYSLSRVMALARGFAESNMTSTVQIVRKQPPVFDDVTGDLASGAPLLVYSGKARVTPASGLVRFSFGDEPSYFSSAVVSVPVVTEVLPRVDDLVLVVTSPGDSMMAGRVFTVQHVDAGGQFPAVRQLQVVGVQESQQWVFDFGVDGRAASGVAAGGVGGFGVV